MIKIQINHMNWLNCCISIGNTKKNYLFCNFMLLTSVFLLKFEHINVLIFLGMYWIWDLEWAAEKGSHFLFNQKNLKILLKSAVNKFMEICQNETKIQHVCPFGLKSSFYSQFQKLPWINQIEHIKHNLIVKEKNVLQWQKIWKEN